MQHAQGAGLIAPSSRSAPVCPVLRPTTVAAALAALQEGANPPTLVAGGTDLCVQYNEGLQPAALVALDRIATLRDISLANGVLWIGSGVTHAQGYSDALVRKSVPGFAEAWQRLANVRVRFWATIGGNLMAQRPRYEMSLLLTALGASLEFLDAAGATVRLTPADLWAGRAPARGLLHRIGIPMHDGARLLYDRSLRPTATLALHHHKDGALAVFATERLRPQALPVPPSLPEQAAATAFAGLPEDFADAVSPHWYLRRVGTVMLRRALEQARGHG